MNEACPDLYLIILYLHNYTGDRELYVMFVVSIGMYCAHIMRAYYHVILLHMCYVNSRALDQKNDAEVKTNKHILQSERDGWESLDEQATESAEWNVVTDQTGTTGMLVPASQTAD